MNQQHRITSAIEEMLLFPFALPMSTFRYWNSKQLVLLCCKPRVTSKESWVFFIIITEQSSEPEVKQDLLTQKREIDCGVD